MSLVTYMMYICFFLCCSCCCRQEPLHSWNTPGLNYRGQDASVLSQVLSFYCCLLCCLFAVKLQSLDGFVLVTLGDGTVIYLSESIHKHLGLFQVRCRREV